MDIKKVIEEFNKYTSNYDKSIMEISLKYNHSFEVMRLMSELGFRLNLNEEDMKIARTIGLLHDIGRFEQFTKYNELSDKHSDHADESCVYLFQKGNIRSFIDTNEYDNLIEKAIRYHNKFSLPDDLNDRERLFCSMIRDMDKIDIYKQLAIEYDFRFSADEVNKSVLEQFNRNKPILREYDQSDSDYVILCLAFIFDFNYNESLDILVETDNFDLFLSTIEVDKDSEKLWRKLREVCFSWINRGIEEDSYVR